MEHATIRISAFQYGLLIGLIHYAQEICTNKAARGDEAAKLALESLNSLEKHLYEAKPSWKEDLQIIFPNGQYFKTEKSPFKRKRNRWHLFAIFLGVLGILLIVYEILTLMILQYVQ